MRRSNNPVAVEDDNGNIIAINLGYDFCAEHECGVRQLRREMGIPADEPQDGLDYHSAKKPDKELLMSFTKNKHHFIIFDGMISWYHNDPERLDNLKEGYGKGGRDLGFPTWRGDTEPKVLSAAWDEGGFGIAIGKDAPDKLKEFGKKLEVAIENGDFSVWFGGGNKGNPFDRSGLVVAITSLVPQQIKDYMVEQYKEVARLKAADEATGIKEYLKLKDKRYFACSPRFAGDGVSVTYWLNPMEQQKHNYGWFTADELRAWADGVVGNKIDMVKK